MSGLYVQAGDDRLGPLTDDEVRAGLQSGRFALGAMSWREGEPRWSSLGRRYKAAGARGWAGPAFAILWALAAAACVAIPIGAEKYLPPIAREPLAFAAVGTAAAVAAIVVLALWWRHPHDPKRPRPMAVLGAVVLVLTVFAGAGTMALRMRVEGVRKHYMDAKITVSPDGQTVRMDGYVGAHLVRDLDAVLAKAPNATVVELESPGGLIDNALEAGKHIADKGLKVRVQGMCASACVLIWASAPVRELGLHAVLGLHQSRMDDVLPDAWKKQALGQLAPEERRVLEAAGFGPHLLELRAATKPDDMTWVDAYDLSAGGVRLRTLAEQGGDANAMDQLAAHVLRRDTHDPLVWQFVLAYAAAFPDRAYPRLTAISAAQDRDDTRAQEQLWRQVWDEGKALGLQHAPDQAIIGWAREMIALTQPAVDARSETTCRTILGVEGAHDLPTTNQRTEALVHLLQATPTGRPAVPTRPALNDQARVLIRASLIDRIRHGQPEQYDRWSPLQKCALLSHLWQTSLDRPAPVAAAYVRYIELGS